MIEIEVALPRPSSALQDIKARMEQQIRDAHSAAVDADSDEADAVVWFITSSYKALCEQHLV